MKVTVLPRSIRFLASASLFACAGFFSPAQAQPKEITIAYFLEWPQPNLIYKADGTFDKEMGVKVNWRSFGNGNEMSAAMASGDVQIAYSQGLVPFIVAVSRGVPLKLVGIASSYDENDNCVVRKGTNITKANAKELEGKKVATPLGNVTHFKLLRTLEYLKVDAAKVKMLQMNPADGAAALARGDVDMACGFGHALQRMKQYGEVLMTGKEQAAVGIRVFDVVSTTEKFAKENPGLMTKFLQLTEDANKKLAADPSKYIPVIAKQAGIKPEDAKSMLGLFEFPTRDEQMNEKWMGGGVQKFVNEAAKFYVQQGQIPKALDNYESTIDPSFMRAVK